MLDYKKDFFEAINHEWINSKQLGTDQTHIDNFVEVTERVENYLYNEAKKWVSDEDRQPSYLNNFVTLYRQALDFSRRESLGVHPLVSVLNRYRNMSSFDDYISQLSELELLGLPNFLPFYVSPDLEESSKNRVWASAPGLIFSDASLYDEDNEQGKELLKLWGTCQSELLKEAGLSDNEVQDILTKIIELEKFLSSCFQTDWASVEDYKVYEFEEFKKFVPSLLLDNFFSALVGMVPNQIVVTDEHFWKTKAHELYSEKMWENIKAKLLYNVITMYSHCLTEKISELSSRFQNLIMGVKKNVYDKEKEAYGLTQFAIGSDLSYWYSNQILSAKDKSNVERLVNEIIKSYKYQLENSQNLPIGLRQYIVTKLDNLVVQIGGPEMSPHSKIHLSSDKPLLDSVSMILSAVAKSSWDKLLKTNVRDDWEIDSFTVNAYYNAQMNKIVIPAGILQKPFYSSDYSFEKNLARIGFLIAHEISHAFDIDGILFDKFGNRICRESEEDTVYFESLVNRIVSKYAIQGIKKYNIDNWQTLSENIADLAGFACVEKIMLEKSSGNWEDFYSSFASLWRTKQRPEYQDMSILSDTHLPNKLRVNSLLSNSKTFIEFYNLSEKDEMYLDFEEHIQLF
ncbi:TPA: M13 family metallopeptidase [Streptococcus suis]